MSRFHHLLTGCALAACAGALAAQSYPQSNYPAASYGPVGDADQLAQELRTVAADPTNVFALINAGRLSLKVGDTDGAAALYTRAERIAPGNPQVKAGMARLLVNAQRPGEALRLFADAAQTGASERDFGPDRALAYDLIGEQERAQREYRSLLRLGADDETVRRYALSLGISGLKEPALALLEPLNRRGDRGAWRARAFVLAMNADRRGAETIATTMMPAGMADGLKPFFDRLPKLSPSDRAFAVHFGEVRGNAARYADARRAPPLSALASEPNPFPVRGAVLVAAAEPTGKKKKKDKRAPAVRLAAAQPYIAPLPPPPAPTATQIAALGSTRSSLSPSFADRGPTILPPPANAYRPAQTQLAANLPQIRQRPGQQPTTIADDSGDEGPDEVIAPSVAKPVARPIAKTIPSVAAPVTVVASATPVTVVPPLAAPMVSIATVQPALPSPAPVQVATVEPGFSQAPLLPVPTAQTIVIPQETPASTLGSDAIASFTPALAASAPVAEPVAAAPAVATTTPPLGPPPAAQGGTGDAVLAAIVAGIQVPPSEQDTGPAPLGEAKLLTTVEKKAETRAVVAAAKVAADQPQLPEKDTRGRFVDASGKPLLDARGRPLGPKAAAAWLLAHPVATAAAKTQPAKDKRGRFVDAKGKPLLDARGRPLTEKAAAAWLAAHSDEADSKSKAADRADAALPTKDRRGRFVDARGRPLLDSRGRPLTEKAATAWQAAQADATPTKSKADATLPTKDARGRYVDAKGKPLLDTRGRPLTAKAAAAWKSTQDDTPAAKKKADAKTETGRYWVQVAGGSNEQTLAKEWKRVSGSTAALKGKQGWTTPLKATNRILTGPFKSSAEAMATVNQLKKQGVSAFMFTSDPGQKITRLSAQ